MNKGALGRGGGGLYNWAKKGISKQATYTHCSGADQKYTF